MISTVTTLIQGSPNIDFEFLHQKSDRRIFLDTKELRQVLGEDIPLNEPEILRWIGDYLREQYEI